MSPAAEGSAAPGLLWAAGRSSSVRNGSVEVDAHARAKGAC
jgi:hypothetical protein